MRMETFIRKALQHAGDHGEADDATARHRYSSSSA